MAERPAALSFLPRFLWYWLPVLMYVCMILTLSGQPHLRPPFHFAFADKASHMLEYSGLGVLLAQALRAGRPAAMSMRTAIAAIALGMIMGAGDEFFQSFVPGRTSDILDVLADTTGVVLAQLALRFVVRR